MKSTFLLVLILVSISFVSSSHNETQYERPPPLIRQNAIVSSIQSTFEYSEQFDSFLTKFDSFKTQIKWKYIIDSEFSDFIDSILLPEVSFYDVVDAVHNLFHNKEFRSRVIDLLEDTNFQELNQFVEAFFNDKEVIAVATEFPLKFINSLLDDSVIQTLIEKIEAIVSRPCSSINCMLVGWRFNDFLEEFNELKDIDYTEVNELFGVDFNDIIKLVEDVITHKSFQQLVVNFIEYEKDITELVVSSIPAISKSIESHFISSDLFNHPKVQRLISLVERETTNPILDALVTLIVQGPTDLYEYNPYTDECVLRDPYTDRCIY